MPYVASIQIKTYVRNYLKYYVSNFFWQNLFLKAQQEFTILKMDELTQNPTIFNILRWLNGSMGQTTHRPCVRLMFPVLSFFIISYRLNSILKIIKSKKINWTDFCKEFCKKSWKKILGTSDAWSMSCLSHPGIYRWSIILADIGQALFFPKFIKNLAQ